MELVPKSPQETAIVTVTPSAITVTGPPSTGTTVVTTVTPTISSTTHNPSGTASTTLAAPGSDGGGLGSGAVAGVAIGCVIAGIAIGAIAAIWFLRRRQRNIGPEETQYMLANTAGGVYDPKDPMGVVTATDPFRLDQILPPPLPDEVISAELQNLSQIIQQHVVENYHRELVPVDQNALHRALHDLGLGNDSAIPSGQLVILAVSPQGRTTALQHIIARAATASVVLSSTARYSLLPLSMSAFMREVAPTERDRGSARAVAAAFARWRQISTFLINPNRSDRTPLQPTEAMTGHKARELVAALNVLLDPFVDHNRVESHIQQAQLYDVVMKVAQFGYMLISQPGEFRLRWDAGPPMTVGSDVVVNTKSPWRRTKKVTESAESKDSIYPPEWPLKSNTPADIQSAYPMLPSSRGLAPPRPSSANSMSPTIFNVGGPERILVPESAGRRNKRASWGIFLNPRRAAPKSPQHRELGDSDVADMDRMTAKVEARLIAIQGDKTDFFRRGKAGRPSPRVVSSESWDSDAPARPDGHTPTPTINTPIERARQQNRHTVHLDMTYGSKTIGNGLLLRSEPSEQGRIVTQQAAVTSKAVSDSVVTITCTEPTSCYTYDSSSPSGMPAAMEPVPSIPPSQGRSEFLDPALLFFVPRNKPVTRHNLVTKTSIIRHHEDTASPVGTTLCAPPTTKNLPQAFELEATPISPCGSESRSKSSSTTVSPLENEPGDTLPELNVPGPPETRGADMGSGGMPEVGLGQPSAPSSLYSADEHTLVDGGEEEAAAEAAVGLGIHKESTLVKLEPMYHNAIKARIMTNSPTGNTACDAWLVRSRMFQLGGSPIVASSPVHEADRFLSPALA
ncbi:hypothetical protein PpBr36_01047 [Pyricularia pennisetigena]|uniref:hypothetical protein n=1 Tax=Pyricularia pennisetigena TaxID=1578925 RepID=UPI00114E766E|nr:hypothetical protein PpBr36_01047 [Pyricularia pennisetigena]TLS28764.1 hypothetical protein PpBr36_01047 [Pyricularia pennisetigena]